MKIYKPNTPNQLIVGAWPKRASTPDGKTVEGFNKAVEAGNLNPNNYDWWELTSDNSSQARIQTQSASTYTKNGNVYEEQKTYSIAANFKDILSEYITEKRYEKEVGGLEVNGLTIKTDRESQSMIIGATVLIGDEETLKWKTGAGFIDLTGAQIKGIATLVRNHIQDCFNREAELLAQLENITEETALAFEETVSLFWPQS